MKIKREETEESTGGGLGSLSVPFTFFPSTTFSMHFTFTSSPLFESLERLSGGGGEGVILIMAYTQGGSAQKGYLIKALGI